MARQRPGHAQVIREAFPGSGPWMLADTPGGLEGLREMVDPRLRDIVDELSPAERTPALSFVLHGRYTSDTSVELPVIAIPVRETDEQLVGTV